MATTPDPIGPYVIQEKLGEGGYGSVYRAFLQGVEAQPIALKLIPVRGNVDRLKQEPMLLSKMKHPSVVGVQDYFIHKGQLVIALEYISGGDLREFLAKHGPLSSEEVREFLAQIGGALEESHAKGVIHRDIKPANILLDTSKGKRRFVLSDFGIGRESGGLLMRKLAGGTLQYMSPEQLRGRPDIQSDLWSLGVVAYEALTGKLPFSGKTRQEITRSIYYDTPTAPSQLSDHPVARDIEEAILKLLEKTPTARFDSANELVQSLRQVGGGEQSTGFREQLPQAARRESELEADLVRKVRANRWAAVTCLVLFAAGSGALLNLFAGLGMLLFIGADRSASEGRKAWPLRAAGLALMAVPVLGFLVPWLKLVLALPDLIGLALVAMIILPVAPVLAPLALLMYPLALLLLAMTAVSRYGAMRRYDRELMLFRLAARGEVRSGEYLGLLHGIVDERAEDVGLHLRYAEALFAKGDILGAAVEARLALVQDGYHFEGNLLLADAYCLLGLPDDAIALCNRYLEFSSHAFEFIELRNQCLMRKHA